MESPTDRADRSAHEDREGKHEYLALSMGKARQSTSDFFADNVISMAYFVEDMTDATMRRCFERGPSPEELLKFRILLRDLSAGAEFLGQVFGFTANKNVSELVCKNFDKGVQLSISLAEKILSGAKFEWWDIDTYARMSADMEDYVCKGQLLRVLGKYSLERAAGWGPLLIANHPRLFPRRSCFFIDALSNATMTNFGQGYPMHVTAANVVLETTGGANCQVYHPGIFFKNAAEALLQLVPWNGKVAFFTSGGDANSAAMSYCRHYVQRRKNLRNDASLKAIFFDQAYHGNVETTAGRVTTGVDKLMEVGDGATNYIALEFPYRDDQVDAAVAELQRIVQDADVQSIIFEATQGDGGGVTMNSRFFVEMVKLSLDHDIPLIDDEVQSGWYRTGRLWCVDNLLVHWRQSMYVMEDGYPPDPPFCIALGKGITNGVIPGSAVLVPEHIAQYVERAEGLQSYTGHPLALGTIIAQCTLMKGMDEFIGREVARKRELFERTLAPFRRAPGSIIGETSGYGLHLFVNIKGPRNNQVVGAELLGRYRVMTGTVSRGRLRVHAPINAPDIVWKALAHAVGSAALDVVRHGPTPETVRILKAGSSGFAERELAPPPVSQRGSPALGYALSPTETASYGGGSSGLSSLPLSPPSGLAGLAQPGAVLGGGMGAAGDEQDRARVTEQLAGLDLAGNGRMS